MQTNMLKNQLLFSVIFEWKCVIKYKKCEHGDIKTENRLPDSQTTTYKKKT